MRRLYAVVATLSRIGLAAAGSDWIAKDLSLDLNGYPEPFRNKPPDYPKYMVDNTRNLNQVAPINGEINGPSWPYSGSLENFMAKLGQQNFSSSEFHQRFSEKGNNTLESQLDSYWLPSLASLGKQPLAGASYTFYRDVTIYGAKGNGIKDDAEAINAAILDGARCGLECGNTFTQGAIIYFPPGTYKICSPIVQLYYTQFIGDPRNRPIIKGCDNFTGIALIDTDPYIPLKAGPDGRGINWYVNQNQFFRQIRNFVFDMTEMPLKTDDKSQPLVPTGIHWQVSQATSLQNLYFKMPVRHADRNVTHVGIFTENGSGGFVSDLEFEGGAIGWRVGSQQYTARGLKFTNCNTAVQMIWDWGFNWQQIEIHGGAIAFDISGKGGIRGDGIGSVSIIDSTITNTIIGVFTSLPKDLQPNIVIDNTIFDNVAVHVGANGVTILPGAIGRKSTVDLWAMGRRYSGGKGEYQTGDVKNRQSKSNNLLSGGRLFVRSRPQYESLSPSSFLVATLEKISNDGSGDNTANINAFLRKALATNKIAYFPAGIYSIQGTVVIPTGSRVQGSSWSQIQATGAYFQDMKIPRVAVKVGEKGDVGTMEIVEMMFTVKGPTAGAIMVEWNVHESFQGAAGMWDSHIRIGGATGSELDNQKCPKGSFSEACISVSLMLHVTPKASGYFENVWAWVADHDNDMSTYWEVDPLVSQVSLYGGRGMLIESQGPCWFYGTGSEHAVLYQYQLHKAKDIYLSHIQTESPYFQPKPVAPAPFESSVALAYFNADPTFKECTTDSCRAAWGLRIVDSENIIVHGAGLYSWFSDYKQACIDPENCQERIMEVIGSKAITIFNIFTKGVVEVGSAAGGNIQRKDGNQLGYTTEISVWVPIADYNVVYIGAEVYSGHVAQCSAPCIMVIAPSPLPQPTTISMLPFTTSLEIGAPKIVNGVTVFVVTTTTITIAVPAITTNRIPVSNVNVTVGQTDGAVFLPSASVQLPLQTILVPGVDGVLTPRIVQLPPWPAITSGPPDTRRTTAGPWPNAINTGRFGGVNGASDDWPDVGPGGSGSFSDVPGGSNITPGGSVPSNVAGGGDAGRGNVPWSPIIHRCPPNTVYVSMYDATITLDSACQGRTKLVWECPPTKTVNIEASTDTTFQLGCTKWIGTGAPLPTYKTWPPGELVWVEENVKDSDDDGRTPCKLWFFFICINWGGLKLGGWQWRFPPGILPPGPPPTIKWPPGVTIHGDLPGPWPPVTIGADHKPTYPPEQPQGCETKSAEICSSTISFDVSVSGRSTKTTATRTLSTCAPILGCENEHVTKTTTSTCKPTTKSVARNIISEPTPSLERRVDTCDPEKVDDAIIYPKDPKQVAEIIAWLQNERFFDPVTRTERTWWSQTKQISARLQTGTFTAFFFVERLTTSKIEALNSNPSVAFCYGIKTWNLEHYIIRQAGQDDDQDGIQRRTLMNPDVSLQSERFKNVRRGDNMYNNMTVGETLAQSAALSVSRSPYWELSQISCAPGDDWSTTDYRNPLNRFPPRWQYLADDSFGSGQTIYVVEDAVFDIAEISNGNRGGGQRTHLLPIDFGNLHRAAAYTKHGTQVTSRLWGLNLGLARHANLVLVENTNRDPEDPYQKIHERHLESLIRVLADVVTHHSAREGKVIVNMSFGWSTQDFHDHMPPAHKDMLYKILQELDSLNVVLVAAAHNWSRWPGRKNSMEFYPALFGDPDETVHPLKNLIVVGGIDKNTAVSVDSPYQKWLVMAPSWAVNTAGANNVIAPDSGNSLAAPLVVGLIAYWRGLPGVKARWKEELKSPQNVKKLLFFLQRELIPFPYQFLGLELPENSVTKQKVPFIWSGQKLSGGNCLVDPSIPGCPTFPESLADLEPFGANCALNKRGEGGSCRLPGAGSNSGISPITYKPGSPSPTCLSNCGTLCIGFFCATNPTGSPPDFHDPKDPAYNGKPPSQSPFPVLPTGNPLPSDCPGPVTASTQVICNGSGGRQACVTSTSRVCAPVPKSTSGCKSSADCTTHGGEQGSPPAPQPEPAPKSGCKSSADCTTHGGEQVPPPVPPVPKSTSGCKSSADCTTHGGEQGNGPSPAPQPDPASKPGPKPRCEENNPYLIGCTPLNWESCNRGSGGGHTINCKITVLKRNILRFLGSGFRSVKLGEV